MPTDPTRRDFLSAAALSLLDAGEMHAMGGRVFALLLADGLSGPTITPSQFGAVGDGLADDTAALQRAVAAATMQGSILDLDRGTYKVTGSITGSGDIRIVNSRGAVIAAHSGVYRHYGVLAFTGRALQAGRLSASPAKGATALMTASATGFAAGDIGTIYDPADSSYSGFRRYYRAGEFFEVASASNTTLSLRKPLYARYDRKAVDVYKIEPITGYIRDIVITSQGGPESLIVIDYANQFEVSNPALHHTNNACIVFSRSIGCTLKNPKIENAGNGGDDYGAVWSNCQHCRLLGGEIYARRHAVALGGADQVNCVPCRDVIVEGAILRNDPAVRVHCADIHGNSEQCGYVGCTIFGGFSPQGRASFLRNCIVYATSIGTAVYAAEILGGEHVIEGNTFYFKTDPSQVSRGAIDFGGNSDAITSNTVDALTIVVRKNILISTAFSGITTLLYARNAGSVAKINVRFVDNDLRVNDFSAIVMIRRAAGIASSDILEVERNSTSLGRRPTFYPDGEYSTLPAVRARTNE